MSELTETRQKSEQYENAKEAYLAGDITEEEFEKRVDGFFQEDKDGDFIEYEESATEKVSRTGSSLKQKLAYYSLPICVLAPIVGVILMPGLSPMLAITAGVPLALLGLILWGYLKIKGHI